MSKNKTIDFLKQYVKKDQYEIYATSEVDVHRKKLRAHAILSKIYAKIQKRDEHQNKVIDHAFKAYSHFDHLVKESYKRVESEWIPYNSRPLNDTIECKVSRLGTLVHCRERILNDLDNHYWKLPHKYANLPVPDIHQNLAVGNVKLKAELVELKKIEQSVRSRKRKDLECGLVILD